MRHISPLVFLVLAPIAYAAPPVVLTAPAPVKLYNGAAGLNAPVLITPPSDDAIMSQCSGKTKTGRVKLEFVVDTEGRPRNIVFDKFTGNALDYLAVHYMNGERFRAASLAGMPVPVMGIMEMRLKGCFESKKTISRMDMTSVRLRELPNLKFSVPGNPSASATLAPYSEQDWGAARAYSTGPGVKAPTPLYTPAPIFSTYARKHHIQGLQTFDLIVDEHGLPRDIKARQPTIPALYAEALASIERYRFKPARKDGMPVPVRLTIQVDFRLY